MTRETLLKILIGAALAGLIFSGFSTFDFAQHLDRQEHSVHCSFVPGLGAPDATGSSGCQVAMMSPYSSVLRQSFWGGVPIALPSMSVFAFLIFFGLTSLLGKHTERSWLGFLALATALPVVASIAMAIISIVTLGTVCKLCVGIYVASAVAFGAAVLAWRGGIGGRNRFAEIADEHSEPGVSSESSDDDDEPVTLWPPVRSKRPGLALMFASGVLFVAVPVGAWVGTAPDVDPMISDCGFLDYPSDIYRVMVDLDAGNKAADAVEVMDPLCPACRAFEDRLVAAGLDQQVSRKILLFPLDNACNWMVDRAVHPGACTVSEAILCAGNDGASVLEWAFDEQEAIREAATQDPRAARRMVLERFPKLRSCVGSASVRAKINKSLRWTVRNRLPLLTPQFYIEGVKLCDEDVDLGLDYAISTLVAQHVAGTLPKLNRPPRPPPSVMPVEPSTETAPLDAAGDSAAEGDVPAAAAEVGEAAAEAQGDVPAEESPTEPEEESDTEPPTEEAAEPAVAPEPEAAEPAVAPTPEEVEL